MLSMVEYTVIFLFYYSK